MSTDAELEVAATAYILKEPDSKHACPACGEITAYVTDIKTFITGAKWQASRAQETKELTQLRGLVRCADSIFKSIQKSFAQWNDGEHMDYRDWIDAKKNSGYQVPEIVHDGNHELPVDRPAQELTKALQLMREMAEALKDEDNHWHRFDEEHERTCTACNAYAKYRASHWGKE